VLDYYFNKYGAQDRIPRTEPRGVSINSFEECLVIVMDYIKKTNAGNLQGRIV
jgi:hypothetical protein